jgi:DNA polymerase-3 subunit gamma/tau
MSQALYRKWRPHRWEDVIGQEHVIQTLRNAVAAGRVVHACLFAGPRGTGKTTTARLLAKALNCLDDDLAARPCDHCEHCKAVNEGRFLDLIEIDAASNTSVEDVRDLRDKIGFMPNQGRVKVYIIDEVHMLSTAAFNALLKTLEEPPKHAMFILATTEIHKIPATVLSRCQRHEFRRIPVVEIVRYLKRIVKSEKIHIDEGALDLVARQSAGGMRDAISLLDQLASTGNQVTLELAHTVLGTATSASVLELVDALLEHDSAKGLDVLNQALESGADPRQLSRQIVEYLRSLLMMKSRNSEMLDLTQEMRALMGKHAQALQTPELLRLVKIFNQAAVESRVSWMPGLPLEMAFLEALEPAAAEPVPVSAHGQSAAVRPAPRPTRPVSSSPSVRDASEQPSPTLQETAGSAVADVHAASTEPGPSQELEQNWKRIIDLTRQHSPTTYGLLNSARARQLKDGVLILGFEGDVLRHKMDTAVNLDVLRSVLHQVFGEDIQIRVVTITGKRTTPPAGVDSDGMVASALRDLGGEIVDIH